MASDDAYESNWLRRLSADKLVQGFEGEPHAQYEQILDAKLAQITFPVSEALYTYHQRNIEDTLAYHQNKPNADSDVIAKLEKQLIRREKDGKPILTYREAAIAYYLYDEDRAEELGRISTEEYAKQLNARRGLNDLFWNEQEEVEDIRATPPSRQEVTEAIQAFAETLYNPSIPVNFALDAAQAALIARKVADAMKSAREAALDDPLQPLPRRT